MADTEIEFVEEEDSALAGMEAQQFSQAVLHAADWTVETIVSQLTRGNIEMNPRFQRRDAWSMRRKSAFIESLILGLPVPQIVLAEKQGQRGRYIVLDGKQRLLALMQFMGAAEGPNNAFRLIGLAARPDLARKTFEGLKDPALEGDWNAFSNYTVRTVVIRNWPSYEFLHLVFLRLNTGSVKLSPQELRQAMFPGDFSDFVDDQAANSIGLRVLLGRDDPDPRMRDVELLVRFLGFHLFLPVYPGRMKEFLDETCGELNKNWEARHSEVNEAIDAFNEAIIALMEIFMGGVARKQDSRSFNRAIFDALVFYAANKSIRDSMLERQDEVRAAYTTVINDQSFLDASESDTAGVPNTFARLEIWGRSLREVLDIDFALPTLRVAIPDDPNGKTGIDFGGFGV